MPTTPSRYSAEYPVALARGQLPPPSSTSLDSPLESQSTDELSRQILVEAKTHPDRTLLPQPPDTSQIETAARRSLCQSPIWKACRDSKQHKRTQAPEQRAHKGYPAVRKHRRRMGAITGRVTTCRRATRGAKSKDRRGRQGNRQKRHQSQHCGRAGG